jgi:lipopolysaccharide heptosyltransferase II
MNLRRLIRKIRFKPFGTAKRFIQQCLYLAIFIFGLLIFFILRNLKIIRVEKFSRDKIKKILIFRPDRIGDLILATPVFKALRENLPGSYIAVLVDEKNKDLIVNNPYINEIFTIRHKGVSGIFKNKGLIAKLQNKAFDLAVILYPALWCGLLAVCCKIPRRLGYNFHGNSFLFTLIPPEKYERLYKHEVWVNLDLLKFIGVEASDVELHVSILQHAEKKVDSFLSENGLSCDDRIVVVHPGAYEEYIRWTKEGFARVADCLINDFNAKVVILGGQNEEALVKEVIALMHQRPVAALGLGISEAVSLIKRARLFIGNSTGPMHIAAALRVPIVAIFGNIHPMDSYKKWGPFSRNSIVVQKAVGCLECNPSDCRHYKCMEAVSYKDVLEAAKKFI